jgi:hypothetical protein
MKDEVSAEPDAEDWLIGGTSRRRHTNPTLAPLPLGRIASVRRVPY